MNEPSGSTGGGAPVACAVAKEDAAEVLPIGLHSQGLIADLARLAAPTDYGLEDALGRDEHRIRNEHPVRVACLGDRKAIAKPHHVLEDVGSVEGRNHAIAGDVAGEALVRVKRAEFDYVLSG